MMLPLDVVVMTVNDDEVRRERGQTGDLPHGREERGRRARAVVGQLDAEFGPCSSYAECVRVCPAGIPLEAVAAVHQSTVNA